MNANFKRVARHIGWGDPGERGLWFIGIEETLEWRQSDVDALPQSEDEKATYQPIDPDAPDHRAEERTRTRIPEWESKIASTVSKGTRDWRTYRDCLWLPDHRVFSGNLFPLGKRRTRHWPPHYKELFEFGAEDQAAYVRAVHELRYPALRDFWHCSGPAATIAFGKKRWPEFKRAFDLPEEASSSAQGCLEFYERDHVVLAPFFGYWHMTDSLAQTISVQLANWGVSIP